MERNIAPSSRAHPSALMIKALISSLRSSQDPDSVLYFPSLAETITDPQPNIKPHPLSTTGRASIMTRQGPFTELCSICKDFISDFASHLPCDHYFHNGCIDEWFQRHSTCPICRRNIDYY